MGQGASSGLTTGWPLQLLPSPGLRVFIPPMGTFAPLCPLHRCPVKLSISNHQGGFPHIPWQPSSLLPAVRTLYKALDCSLPPGQVERRAKGEVSGQDRGFPARAPAPPLAPMAAEWKSSPSVTEL